MEISKLFEVINPKEAVSYFTELLNEFKDFESFKWRYREAIESRVRLEGRGFRPVTVSLGGLMSIAGLVVTMMVFDNIKYVITSPEVWEGNPPPFKLSHEYLEAVRDVIEDVIVVPFNEVPMYGNADKLLNVLRKGAVVLQGVSAELAVWFGRNAGIGRLIIYRPENGYGVFRYV